MDGATLYLCPIIDKEHQRALDREGRREREGKGSKEELRGDGEQYNWRQFERFGHKDMAGCGRKNCPFHLIGSEL